MEFCGKDVMEQMYWPAPPAVPWPPSGELQDFRVMGRRHALQAEAVVTPPPAALHGFATFKVFAEALEKVTNEEVRGVQQKL